MLFLFQHCDYDCEALRLCAIQFEKRDSNLWCHDPKLTSLDAVLLPNKQADNVKFQILYSIADRIITTFYLALFVDIIDSHVLPIICYTLFSLANNVCKIIPSHVFYSWKLRIIIIFQLFVTITQTLTWNIILPFSLVHLQRETIPITAKTYNI